MRTHRIVRTSALAAVLLLGVLGGCSSSDDDGAAGESSAPTTAGGSAAATTTAAADESGEPDDVATDPEPSAPEPGASDLEVAISFADVAPDGAALEVSAFVPGVVESGGSCTLVLHRGGRDDVTVETDAFADAQSTGCDLLTVPVEQLDSGVWTARVEYRSSRYSGTSEPREVNVP